ncbi:universal stress protein [Mycobacterium asiaticum]|uniref:Universal stress protein n=1 Tax=Mycobacterium asiaticum TaxID=1790 RepID=A0A1A3NC97_MYCAS|nr:universal stress protein [Mycobacterium asiaticum]OBK19401.1 universal stress protein [Mycobacterium asiaticum]
MTVVVGYRASKIGLPGLYFAVGAARTLDTSLTVATVVPQPWPTPSFARVDAEFENWAAHLAEDSEREARQYLRPLAEGIEVQFRQRTNRSVAAGLAEIVDEVDGRILVLGSLPAGGRAHMLIGSTADWLLHAARVPVAISAPGYHVHTGGFRRMSCGYSTSEQSLALVRRCAAAAERYGVPLRVITFAVRGRTMYPPEVGLEAEDSILKAWAAQAMASLQALKEDGAVGEDTVLEVVTGHSWMEVLDKPEWIHGEILAVGTTPRVDVRRAFLGTRSAKIIRHSPVPVLVVPG